MVETVVAELGGLHIAVNNAGINKNSAAEDTTEQDWDLTFDLNTKGVFLCCQVCSSSSSTVLTNTWLATCDVYFNITFIPECYGCLPVVDGHTIFVPLVLGQSKFHSVTSMFATSILARRVRTGIHCIHLW